MACYRPIKGFRGVDGSLVMARHKSTGIPMQVPCRQCIGCRLEYSRQWAVRIMHEAQMHRDNAFLTLTYADHTLPDSGSLDVLDVQKFFKRFRKAIAPTKIRYYCVGEYGDQTRRPHYHICLFGYGFPDKVLKTIRGEHRVYNSAFLESVWPLGMSEIGSLTFESAAYCARYVTKKVTGKRAKDHYTRVDPETGEIYDIAPEFATMSRRPGIGHGWLEKYGKDVYPSDEVITRGKSGKPPRYYDRVFSEENPEEFEKIRERRVRRRDRENQTDERLAVREVVTKARSELFQKRGM